jgi:CheY-like chemotaxis protein
LQSSSYLNLDKAVALVVDDNAQALDIIVSVLSSFGLRNIVRASSAVEAVELVQRQSFDLILTDAHMPEMDGYEFVHWMRHKGPEAARVTPTVVITAHTRRSQVLKARDCGANFIIAKPITPKVLLQRIFWVAKGDRMFIESDGYCGPDRRHKNLGPPADHPDGRRRDDVSTELGKAEEPNMSQEQLDNLIKPQKVTAP